MSEHEQEIPLPPATSSRLARWAAQSDGMPPEQLAQWQDRATSPWVVIVEDGPALARQRYTARFELEEEIPFWAYTLCKAYLDDVGEWPLFQFIADTALLLFEDHTDIARATHEVFAALSTVWPEVTLVYLGKGMPETH
ncbi:hypothetical protein Mmc1_2133 [Magnetococcus marinus MC-1]|uniref:Uncharacterized protein n=1 Tax=Magnetococcus marinus (strain ATCC BAA-1437 / JCM 17883 / MC-1) TaxID=156889 RepID=A0L9J1_MAGMM|nr:hypothetical protein [Magnetococcus marinus]ABK44634.1 hypothetical protein Mmc1_2133 [Magnetococcus marinus MC-1]